MLKKARDPVLEKIREDTLRREAIRNQSAEDLADELAERLSRVHASFLFLSDRKSLQKFCLHMSASPAGIMDNAWNALAIGLGFDLLQVQCVRYTAREDFTYLILMSYATKEDAVLGHLIKELKKIQRLDAFTAVQDELKGLASKLEETEAEESMEPSRRLIYPPKYEELKKELNSQLFFTIQQIEEKKERGEEGEVKVVEWAIPRHREESRVQGAAVVRSVPAGPPRVTPKVNVFLTFAEDGAEVAKKITKTLRTAQGKRPQIGVLILDEQRRKVEPNPENFIMHYFHKMNYVIPVLTEGYMEAISCKEPCVDGMMGSLDAKYAFFIKDLANKYYQSNWCRNDKIRCVVPKDKISILQHQHRKLDPIMKAFVYDTEIEELARRITCTFTDD
uniref:Death domain-containing protein n=1 Tax=Lygus hesperus TaxID=30085 RepID=A0A146MEB9_LYGHE